MTEEMIDLLIRILIWIGICLFFTAVMTGFGIILAIFGWKGQEKAIDEDARRHE